jgi:hypothetical protein
MLSRRLSASGLSGAWDPIGLGVSTVLGFISTWLTEGGEAGEAGAA